MPDGGAREPVGTRAIKMIGLMHPLLEVRREMILGWPRPLERAIFRCGNFFYDPLEMYVDLWNGEPL